MKSTLETKLGIFFALALVAIAVILEMVGGPEFFKPGKTISAGFDSVKELKTGDPVKMAGVKIGIVDDIQLASNKVFVTMKIDRDAAVKTDSIATIQFSGLMGQNYLSIGFGSPSAPIVNNNAEIITKEQPDLGTLMAKLESVTTGIDELTKSFSEGGLSELLGPLTDFMKENKTNLTTVIANIEKVTGQVAEGKGTVGKLINEDTLYTSSVDTITNFNATASEANQLLAQARSIVDQIKAGEGTIGKLTTDEMLYRETATAVTNLREILEKINHGSGSAGKLVNDENLYNNARMTLQKVDKATETLEDQGPLSVLGTAAGSLF
ncbi:MAG: MlaD family protein [Verrucomicrobia bacterium]|nr:MlaD family protein [Verrucomicrobiota bacterium]